MPERVSPFLPLKHRDFRLFWTSFQITTFGSLVQGVAAAWLMTTLTSSPSMIALVQTSTSLPILLFSLVAGALADSLDRRLVMLWAQGIMLAVSVALVLASYLDLLTPWSLLGFTFLIGVGTALNSPSWQAAVGDIVPREQVPEAVSLNGMGFNLMRSIGPAIGGAIVANFGAAAAFAINALTYLPFITVLLRWRNPRPETTLAREGLAMAVGAGLRYVAMSPKLLVVIFRAAVFGMGAISCFALLPLIARDLLQGGALAYGVLLGCFGLGAIGGAALNPRIRQRLTAEWVVRAAFLGFAVAVLVLSVSPVLVLSGAATALAGACWVLALSLFNVTIQLSSPRWVVGRALSLYQMASFGGMALGSWLWGELAGSIGLTGSLATAGLCLGIGALAGVLLPLPEFGTQDLTPLDRFRAPDLLLDLRGRSGPILVMIEYRIDIADTQAFLAAMIERRRVRRRDGARQWVLLRDLEHPEQWTESYRVATWDDYLRHNLRRTKADAEVADSLQKLHRGAEPPKVHRMIERQNVLSHADATLKDNGGSV